MSIRHRNAQALSLLLLLALLLPALSGCGQSAIQGEPSASSAPSASSGGDGADAAPTGELAIYCPPGMEVRMDAARAAYQAAHPDVQLTYRTFTSDGDKDAKQVFSDILVAELLAGKGPDLVVFNDELPDLYKAMEAGTLYNLDHLIAGDESFDLGLYNQAVLDGGYYKGRRMFLPLVFEQLCVYTTEETLAAYGMTLPDSPTFQEWSEQIIGYINTHSEQENRSLFTNYDAAWSFAARAGLQIMDYETGDILIGSEEFRRFMEFYKAIYPYFPERNFALTDNAVADVLNGAHLFSFDTQSSGLHSHAAYFRTHGATPKVFAIPNLYDDRPTAVPGYKAAIRAGSPNKANAYDFMKLLVSDNVQNTCYVAVLNRSAARQCLAFLGNSSYQQAAYLENPERTEEQLEQQMQTDVDAYVAFAQDVNCLRNHANAVDELVQTTMAPWVLEQRLYEACLAELQSRLELYRNE